MLWATAAGSNVPMVLPAAYCGLRGGEAAGLRVRDCNLAQRRIRVINNGIEVGRKVIVGTPQNHRRRTVPLPTFIVDRLTDQCRGKEPGDLLFPGPTGERMRPPRGTGGRFENARNVDGARKLDSFGGEKWALDDWGVITLEDWALIRRLAGEGVPKARIAERLGISRTTVIKAVNSDGPPRYERAAGPTSFLVFEPRVRALLAEVPDMPATVLAERVGWTGSSRWFRENVKRLRPEHRRVDPADRLVWLPGDAAQCDLWFPPRKIPLEDGTARLLPVLVITAAYSRFTTGRMIPTRKTEDLVLGSWELLSGLGRVPRRLIWDNEPGIGRGRRRAEGVAAFMGTLAARLVLLPPRDPESKGVVERRNGWFETSFMPGRSFDSPADFNAQFTDWLAKANTRVVRTTGAAPIDRLEADRAGMLPLPPVPLHLGWRNRIRLGRDYYVRLDTNDYSVDPNLIGRIVEVGADLDRVRVRADGRPAGEHRRVWARGTTITDPAHVQAAGVLRKQFQQHRPDAASDDPDQDLHRDLADYDRAFGLLGDGQVG